MIVTHSGRFHADEVFAIAMLQKLEEYKQLEVTRTRDEDLIKQAHIVLDVGGLYEPSELRFDHHQNSFVKQRENTIPFATAGLIWEHFGASIMRKLGLQSSREIEFAVNWVDAKLIQDLDAVDNGWFSDDSRPSVSQLIALMNASADSGETAHQVAFERAIDFASETLDDFCCAAKKEAEVVEELEKLLPSVQNGILVLDKKLPFKDFIADKTIIKRVVYPRDETKFGVYCNGKKNHLPKRFRGLRDQELNQVTGLTDTVFCHKSGFMAVTLSQASAMQLAWEQD